MRCACLSPSSSAFVCQLFGIASSELIKRSAAIKLADSLSNDNCKRSINKLIAVTVLTEIINAKISVKMSPLRISRSSNRKANCISFFPPADQQTSRVDDHIFLPDGCHVSPSPVSCPALYSSQKAVQ